MAATQDLSPGMPVRIPSETDIHGNILTGRVYQILDKYAYNVLYNRVRHRPFVPSLVQVKLDNPMPHAGTTVDWHIFAPEKLEISP